MSIRLGSGGGLPAGGPGVLARATLNGTPTWEEAPPAEIIDGSVTAVKIASALKGGAAAGTEALRALGTTSTTAAAGNDSRLPAGADIVNADIGASAAIAESKLSLASDAAAGTPSRRTLGTGSTQAAAGNHTHIGLTEQAAGTPSVRAIGATGTTVVAGNDSRLTDARAPSDASVTMAKLDSTIKAGLKGVCVHNGSSYPSRPSGFTSVEWIGPDPGGAKQNGDTWADTT